MKHEAESIFDLDREALIGSWRRFGPTGPVYEIIGVGKSIGERGATMKIRLPETMEEIDYPVVDILRDLVET